MAFIPLTVQSKNYKDVSASYTQVFETDLMKDVVDNDDTNLYSGNGTSFSYPADNGQNEAFVVSEDITEIGTAADGAIKKAEVTLTAAQVKALNATPIDVVAAAGAGKGLIPLSGYVYLDATATAYVTNVDLEIIVEDESNSFFFADTSIDGTSDKYTAFKATTLGSTANRLVANKALQVTNLTGEPATGTGTVKVVLFYQEVTL